MDTAAYLREVVTVLARQIGVRSHLEADKLEEAAQYISGQFTSFGYQVVRQPFYFFGNTYCNVIAERTGDSSPDALIVTDTAFYRNPHYHEPTDLPETLDYERMAKVVEGLAAAAS